MTQTPEKKSRAADAYVVLKEEIRMNQLPAGHQATEPELAMRLGVSRTTVREALIRLEAEGLIEIIPRRGARILPLRVDDMEEIYDILTSLEPAMAAKLAQFGLSDSDLGTLNEAVTEMERALEDGNLDRWAEADGHFHLGILDLYGNKRLRSYVAELSEQVHRARMVTLRLRELPFQSNQEHRLIVESIAKGDSEGARQLFLRHRQRAAKELVGILAKMGVQQL